MRTAATMIQALARAVTARESVKALRRLRAAIHVQRFERGRCARADFRKHLGAVAVMQQWSRARLQRLAFLRILRCILRLQRWFHRVVKAIRLHKTTRAVFEIQRWWRGVLGRRAAKKLLQARTHVQETCQKLVLRWRRRVLGRLRQKVHACNAILHRDAEDDVCVHPPCPTPPTQQLTPRFMQTHSAMLEKACRWELNAASELLQRQNGALANQAELLQNLAQELQHRLDIWRDSCFLHQFSRSLGHFLSVAWEGWRDVACNNSILGYL